MAKRVCPRCNGEIAYYMELWKDHSIEYTAHDGIPEDTGILQSGFPYSVLATCAYCLHTWKLRGVNQITELREATNGND